ncbi:MAG: flagellar biosynthetic protein FliQ [Bryobacteraceae bacterium]|nr:flagellar biosynthetic protein FliQ [Bryobacteraceae bacterium]
MTQQQAVDIVRQALMTTFWLGLPLMAVGFLAGVVVSLAQIITSMQDPAVGTVPRLAAFLLGMLLFLPWMLVKLTGYTTTLLEDLGRYAR